MGGLSAMSYTSFIGKYPPVGIFYINAQALIPMEKGPCPHRTRPFNARRSFRAKALHRLLPVSLYRLKDEPSESIASFFGIVNAVSGFICVFPVSFSFLFCNGPSFAGQPNAVAGKAERGGELFPRRIPVEKSAKRTGIIDGRIDADPDIPAAPPGN